MSVIIHVKNRKPYYTGDLVEGVFYMESINKFMELVDSKDSMRHSIEDSEGNIVSFGVIDPDALDIIIEGYFSKVDNHVIMVKIKGVE